MKQIVPILGIILLLNSCAKPTNGCYTYSPSTITTTTQVTFDASCSDNASSYNWDFGDGTEITTNSSSITHTFSTSGTYTVMLVAGRKDGVTFRKEKPTYTQTVIVQ